MSWRIIATADVLRDVTPLEQALINNIQGDAKGANLASILTDTIAEVRGMVKAGGNQVDQKAVTVPDQLRHDAIHIARWDWIISLPQLKTMATPERRQAATDARKRLQGIASQAQDRERVELPANADTTAGPVNGVQVASKTRRKATNRKLDGLI